MWVSETDKNEVRDRDTYTERKTGREKVEKGPFEKKRVGKWKIQELLFVSV